MSSKFYFRKEDDEQCFDEEYFQDVMYNEELKEITVFEARPLWHDEYFWCKHYRQVGEKGNCGRDCEEYKPRNGKSGCCIHFGSLYEPYKEVTLININLNKD